MRDLLRLAVGLILAASGFALIADGEVWAGYRVRDGLLVATLGALVAAWPVAARAVTPAPSGQRTWPQFARTLTLTGAVCGIAAALLLAWLGQDGWSATAGGALWGVGVLLLLIGLFWPGRTLIYPAPSYRWSLDAAGRFVRQALGQGDAYPADATTAPRLVRVAALLMGLALLAGIWLRVRQLTTLPPTCLGSECSAALQLVEGGLPAGLNAASLGLHALLTRGLFAWSGDASAALRWAAAILGSLTLPAWLWAARPFLRLPGMLLGVTGLALLPWAVWTSRMGSDWIALPLLMLLVLGAAARALARPDRRRWGATGLLFGLLLMQPSGPEPLPWLTVAWLAWLLSLALAAWAQARRLGHAFTDHSAVLVGSALAVGLPIALPTLLAPAWGLAADTGWLLLAGLLQRGGAVLEMFRQSPLLPTWVTGAAWVALIGLVMARPLPRGQAVLLAGSWIFPTAAILLGGAQEEIALVWLVSLAPISLLAALSADTLVSHFATLWARLIPPPRVLVVVTVLLVAVLGPSALGLHDQARRAGGTAQSAAAEGMAQYLARCLAGEMTDLLDDPCRVQGDGAPTFLVPPDVLHLPATRLVLSQAAAGDRVRALNPSRDLIPVELPAGDLIFLISLDNQPLIDLLPTLYPAAELRVPFMRDAESGPTTFITARIPRPQLLAQRGLLGEYFAGAPDETTAPVLTQRDGAAAFAWGDFAPLAPPFSAVWEATLLVPEAGAYRFAIAGDAATGVDPALISLTVDGRVVLDTSLGLLERRETLAQGPARVVLRYRGGTVTGNWAIQWAQGDAPLQPIPAQAVVSPALPDLGLVGTYQARDGQGAALALRKDLLLGVDPGLAQAYSVRWQGTLLAPRAGEYLFAVTTGGALTLEINYRRILEHMPATTPGVGPAYSQGSLYLPAGRHVIDIAYAPAGVTDLRLLWQVPGSAPALLPSRYLAPLAPDAMPSGVPLPPPPPLVDARLGDDSFALTASMEMDPPAVSLPPEGLPLLMAEQVWTAAGGCGEELTQFNSPRGLAWDEEAGRLYVADALNRRVVVLDAASGTALTEIRLAAFEEPVDVALEPSGALLVLDALTQAIYRVDPVTGDGAALALGTSFYRPRGLAVDATGNIGVADTGGARVVLLDTAGVPFAQFGGQQTVFGKGQPVDVLTVNGEWWAITAENGRLWRLDGLGSLPAIPRTNTLTGPQLAALPDGAFFLSDPARRSVLYFAPNGRPLAQLGYADAFLNPMGLAATPRDGFIYLAVSDSAACSVSLWRLRPV